MGRLPTVGFRVADSREKRTLRLGAYEAATAASPSFHRRLQRVRSERSLISPADAMRRLSSVVQKLRFIKGTMPGCLPYRTATGC